MLSVSDGPTGGRLPLQVPDVFVVHVDVDEAAQLAVVLEQVLAQVGVPRRELPQHFADVLAVDLDDGLLAGERPQRRGNQNTNGHEGFLSCAPVERLFVVARPVGAKPPRSHDAGPAAATETIT